MTHMFKGGLLLLIVLIFLIIPANALKAPSDYNYGECELIAKDFQREFGDSLVFVAPLNSDGSYEACDSCGHWLNKKYISANNKVYFFDYGNQRIFESTDEIKQFLWDYTFQKVDVFELDRGHPPFAIIYHY